MKIAFLSHIDMNLYLFRLPVMKALVAQGHTVYALCPKGKYSEHFASEGIIYKSYDIERKSLNPFKALKTIRNIYHLLKGLQLDILHNFTVKPNIYGSIAGDLAQVPVIINSVTGMGSYFILQDKKSKTVRKVIERLYKMANKRADAVLFQNDDDRKYFEERQLLSESRSFLIRGSGIDTDVFDSEKTGKQQALREDLGIQGKQVVLMVARAIWDKGVREFYEAAQKLKDENRVFILVGDTDEGNPSCADTAFLRSGFVMWLGHRTDIKELTALADVYVLPSYREGLPRTLLEACSMGRPIVTTDAIGCKDVVDDGINGFLVPVRDVDVLTEKIEILLGDEELRKRFASAGRMKAIKEFDVKIIVEKYLDLYKEMMNKHV